MAAALGGNDTPRARERRRHLAHPRHGVRLTRRLRFSGQKHFGSGSRITSFMVTTAVADEETEADWFFLDVSQVVG